MSVRQSIENEFLVENGVIRSPGKFEGEASYAPYCYSIMLEGWSDILNWPDETRVDIIEVDSEMHAQFPEIDAAIVAIVLEESDQGFVYCTEMCQRDLDRLRRSNDRAWYEHDTSVED